MMSLVEYLVGLRVFWYSNQPVNVPQHNTVSQSFRIGNGTRQGGILSTCLFNCFIYYLLGFCCRSLVQNVDVT